MGKRVKRDLFLTEKEERTKEARQWFLIIILSLLGAIAVVTLKRGWKIWQQGGWQAIMVVLHPRDYIDLQKEYKLYILGEKCCLEAVETKSKE